MKNAMMIVVAGLVMVAGGFAQSSSDWNRQYVQAKFGRSSAVAIRMVEQPVQTAGKDWAEQLFSAKFGRVLPLAEARRNAESAGFAARVETIAAAPQPPDASVRQLFVMKSGRASE